MHAVEWRDPAKAMQTCRGEPGHYRAPSGVTQCCFDLLDPRWFAVVQADDTGQQAPPRSSWSAALPDHLVRNPELVELPPGYHRMRLRRGRDRVPIDRGSSRHVSTVHMTNGKRNPGLLTCGQLGRLWTTGLGSNVTLLSF